MKELAEFAIKEGERLGASYTDVRVEQTSTRGYLLKNSMPELGAFNEREGIGIRMLIDGKLCFTSTDVLAKPNVRKAIACIARSGKAAAKATPSSILFASAPPVKARSVVSQKRQLEDLSPEEPVSYLLGLDAVMKPLASRYLSFSASQTERLFLNSEGSSIEMSMPLQSLFAIGTLGRGKGSMQRFWQKASVGGYEHVPLWAMENTMSDDIKAMVKVQKKGVSSPKGKVDIIVAPEVTGILVHESGGHPYEADRIFGREAAQAGESFITPKTIGRRIAAPCVTLVDDPTLPNSAGFYDYDEEGIKARRKFMLKEGIVTELLHSRETAPYLNVPPNGASRATAFDREPIPRMSNTFILPGKQSRQELIEGVKLGVFIKSFTEWNIDDTRVNQKYVGNEAYMIRNGKLAEPVRQPILELTTYSLYGAIDAVSDEQEFFSGTCGKGEPMQGIPVSMGGPSLRLRDIRLGARHV